MTATDLNPSLQELRAAWPWALFALCLGALIALKFAAVLGKARRHRVAVHRSLRAKRGEELGERLLIAHGYQVLGRQLSLKSSWLVDGEREEYTLRADWLVERDGLRYVADAKTGDWASSVRTRATRRQLLEYVVQYETDGALLVDAERERIVELRFEGVGESTTQGHAGLAWFCCALAVAALITVAFLRR